VLENSPRHARQLAIANGNVLAELEDATADPKSAREAYMAKYPKYELCGSVNEGCYI
jgi:hypothetical protein